MEVFLALARRRIRRAPGPPVDAVGKLATAERTHFMPAPWPHLLRRWQPGGVRRRGGPDRFFYWRPAELDLIVPNTNWVSRATVRA